MSEIFVGNLNPNVRTRDLENVFGKYGKILKCDLKRNYAFIQFDHRGDADEALRKEDNRRLLGSEMTVQWAKSKADDKPFRDGPGNFRRPRSPGRFGGRGRDRSPIGRNGYQGNPRFSPRRPGPRDNDNRFQRRSFGGNSFDRGNPRFDDRSPRNRMDGDRGQYSPRGPPMRERFNNNSPPRNNRFMDSPPPRRDRRDSFSGRPNNFRGPRRF